MKTRQRALGGSTKMLTSAEVAERLGMPLSTFQKRWRGLGIPYYKRDRWLRFMERDVEFWIEQQRQVPGQGLAS